MANRNSYNLHLAIVATDDSTHLPELYNLATRCAALVHQVSFLSTVSGLKVIARHQETPTSNMALIPLPQNDTENVKEGFTMFLSQATIDVHWILFDISAYWATEIGKSLGIATAFITFDSASELLFLLPGILGKTKLHQDDFNPCKHGAAKSYNSKDSKKVVDHLTKQNRDNVPLYCQIEKAVLECTLVALWGNFELGQPIADMLGSKFKVQCWFLGFLKEPMIWNEDLVNIHQWLDQKDSNSVVCVAFETETEFSLLQQKEVADGIVEARFTFIWITSMRNGGALTLPIGFCEQTSSYGLVCPQWVPCEHVLNHKSIGAFLTNGAWRSCLASLHCRIPIILAPISTKDWPNSFFMENSGVGCEIGRDQRSGRFMATHVAEALRMIMTDPSGSQIRREAKAKKDIFSDSENFYLDHFVDLLRGVTKQHSFCKYQNCLQCKHRKRESVCTNATKKV